MGQGLAFACSGWKSTDGAALLRARPDGGLSQHRGDAGASIAFLIKDIKNALFDAVGAVADEKRPQ